MRIKIVGRGPVAEPLARLAERAGHTVDWGEEGAALSRADYVADLVIVAVASTAFETTLMTILPLIEKDVVIVDAIVPDEDEDRGGSETTSSSGTEAMAETVSRARIVRAFASVPAEALAFVLNSPTSEQSGRLAIPFAGDDREAKALVARFMGEIGVEPFDLGALGIAPVLEPGGALWKKALSPIEMLEAVGFLSGDG